MFYGLRTSQYQAFKAAPRHLVDAHYGLALHILDADPTPQDVQGQYLDLPGFVTLDLPKQTLPHGCHTFYTFGPDPMMKALIPALPGWGVADPDMHGESFGPQTAAPRPAAFPVIGPTLAIGFLGSGRRSDWTGQDANLLAFAERHSVPVDASCLGADSGTCETRLNSGRDQYAAKQEFDIAPGHCLPCVGTLPTGLELDA